MVTKQQKERMRILTKLAREPESWEELGDPFILKRILIFQVLLRSIEPLELNFAKSIFSISNNEWSGTIESAYGLHIVKVNEIVSEIIPEFEDIKTAIISQWKEEERRRINKKALAKIIDKYKINIINDKTNNIK